MNNKSVHISGNLSSMGYDKKCLISSMVFGFIFITGGIVSTLVWYAPLYNHIITEKCVINQCNSTETICWQKLRGQSTSYSCYSLCVNYMLVYPEGNTTKSQCIILDEEDENNWCENRKTIKCYLDDRDIHTVNLENTWSEEIINSISLMSILYIMGAFSFISALIPLVLRCFVRKEIKDISLDKF